MAVPAPSRAISTCDTGCPFHFHVVSVSALAGRSSGTSVVESVSFQFGEEGPDRPQLGAPGHLRSFPTCHLGADPEHLAEPRRGPGQVRREGHSDPADRLDRGPQDGRLRAARPP